MDSWTVDHEVEKPKPFADRAQKCLTQIGDQKTALLAIFGGGNGRYLPILTVLQKAADLINEAKSRGVKGKDIGK